MAMALTALALTALALTALALPCQHLGGMPFVEEIVLHQIAEDTWADYLCEDVKAAVVELGGLKELPARVDSGLRRVRRARKEKEEKCYRFSDVEVYFGERLVKKRAKRLILLEKSLTF